MWRLAFAIVLILCLPAYGWKGVHAAIDIAAVYNIPQKAIPRIIIHNQHPNYYGWIDLRVDPQDNITAIGDIHIVVERGARVSPVITLCHEMWHLKQALENRRVKRPQDFLKGQVANASRKMEAFNAVRRCGYSQEAQFREAEAFYMQSVAIEHPRVRRWL